jgi:four helix bundle protein
VRRAAGGEAVRVPATGRSAARQNGCALRRARRYHGAMSYRDLKVLDAADQAADRLNAIIDRSPRGLLLHVQQMRDSVQSIGANISEAFGRGDGRDREHPREIARGEAEETIRHIGSNFRARRMQPADYWPLRNLHVVIVKMLSSMLRG